MSSVVELYEALASAPDERARARVIAEAFERLEERYPHLPDLVTRTHLSETELRLQKEIEQLRGEVKTEIEQLRGELKTDIEQLRGEVRTDIEQLRGELRQTELRLQKEMVQMRGDMTAAIERSRNSLLLWLIPLMFAQVGAMAALVKLL
ncbi:DUF1640 domain-containing protein [Thiocapsa imhoffii]|uniref:DUF1640 domain-containing protein n=1 Tax=Thiocapsa imhoffii TaxID=382777 RepID=A0A9X0WM77_9GAMM|nr:coiled-coil domain-containing protein [Thiocapsa imhoffii]MBK1646854.1 DUF1640 domain-containing protein [Thiocapsa imhoffii]